MKKHRAILFISLLLPLPVMAQEYRAIVEAHALSKPGVKVSEGDEILHVYQPGDTVVLSDSESWSRAATMVIVPGGGEAFVPSHKITDREDLEVERDYYQSMGWDEMSEEDLFYWSIYKDKPVFGHACFVALSGGSFKEKEDIEDLCRKVRRTREVQSAFDDSESALEAMDKEDGKRLLSGEAPIGAPKAAIYLAWGKPEDVKKITTKDDTMEQLIYEDRIVFTSNGFITMIQE